MSAVGVETAVALERVSIKRGGVEVVHDLSLRIERGSWLALIGPNGAGKSSALLAIAGLLRASGSISVLGDDVARLDRRELARRVALVPQAPVVPHCVRLVLKTGSMRVLLPLSLVLGAGFLVLCDLAARTLESPAELPIGIITAFLGAPFFAVVLRSARKLT